MSPDSFFQLLADTVIIRAVMTFRQDIHEQYVGYGINENLNVYGGVTVDKEAAEKAGMHSIMHFIPAKYGGQVYSRIVSNILSGLSGKMVMVSVGTPQFIDEDDWKNIVKKIRDKSIGADDLVYPIFIAFRDTKILVVLNIKIILSDDETAVLSSLIGITSNFRTTTWLDNDFGRIYTDDDIPEPYASAIREAASQIDFIDLAEMPANKLEEIASALETVDNIRHLAKEGLGCNGLVYCIG